MVTPGPRKGVVASCAPDTARRRLARLADIGVVERVSDTPVTYTRNESYVEWRRHDRLEELSASELRERLAGLTSRVRGFRERFGSASPGEVDALDHYHPLPDASTAAAVDREYPTDITRVLTAPVLPWVNERLGTLWEK